VDRVKDLLAVVHSLRDEFREAEDGRQRDADALKLQLSLLLEGNGELSEQTKRQLHTRSVSPARAPPGPNAPPKTSHPSANHPTDGPTNTQTDRDQIGRELRDQIA
jgi:hypothetical protein